MGFGSLEIARSGLYVNERGLFVTGHNLSNVNTPGYVRQQAILETSSYQTNPNYQIGLGADVQQIRQIRHTFLDNVYRNEVQPLGYWETRQKTYQDVQAILGEPMEEGLQHNMNNFWDSWQELSKDPGSLTVRALVRQRADTLVQYVNNVGNQLDKLQTDLNTEILDRIEEVNSLTENIASLNAKILESESAGDSANDLRDQRNLNIDRLSKLIDCQANEMQDGQVNITVGGYFIANNANYEKISAVKNKDGSFFITPAINNGSIKLPINGGIIKGLMESRGEVLGAEGSVENGSVNDKLDLVFALNLNDSSSQRDALLSSIEEMVKTYEEKGISVKLGFVTFDDSGVVDSTTFQADTATFKAAIGGLPFGGLGTAGKLNAALTDAMTKTSDEDLLSGWENTARQMVVLSEKAVDTAGLSNTASQLKLSDFHTLVLSDNSNKSALSMLAEVSGDRFIHSGISTADPTDNASLKDTVMESMRNSAFGDIENTSNILPDILGRLNLLVSSMAREVNRLHRNGSTLDGKQGEDLLVPIDSNYPMEMGNIKLNPNLANLNNIVSATNGGATGDNTVAFGISDLRHLKMLGNFGNVQSLDEFYNSTIMMVGNGGQEAQQTAENQGTLVNSVDNQRLAITNVSMDEEMSNMMKYQFAYGASARVINVLDEMFDSIINRMGVVGR